MEFRQHIAGYLDPVRVQCEAESDSSGKLGAQDGVDRAVVCRLGGCPGAIQQPLGSRNGDARAGT